MKPAFLYHCLRRDLSNFSLIRHRKFDGFLISMHQAGTHWLKHMLATALTRAHGLPPPRYIHANDIIGGPRDPGTGGTLPHLVSAHSIPHILFRSSVFHRLVRLPPSVVLVRDIRACLVSIYEKWKQHYDCDFDEFLRGDVSGHRFNNDIWWCLRFCNSWGYLVHHFPDTALLVRYEDLRKQPLEELQRINRYWKLNLDETTLLYSIEQSSKEKMARKKDPDTPFGVTVVRPGDGSFMEYYRKEQREYLAGVCDRFLKFDFGYDYSER